VSWLPARRTGRLVSITAERSYPRGAAEAGFGFCYSWFPLIRVLAPVMDPAARLHCMYFLQPK